MYFIKNARQIHSRSSFVTVAVVPTVDPIWVSVSHECVCLFRRCCYLYGCWVWVYTDSVVPYWTPLHAVGVAFHFGHCLHAQHIPFVLFHFTFPTISRHGFAMTSNLALLCPANPTLPSFDGCVPAIYTRHGNSLFRFTGLLSLQSQNEYEESMPKPLIIIRRSRCICCWMQSIRYGSFRVSTCVSVM